MADFTASTQVAPSGVRNVPKPGVGIFTPLFNNKTRFNSLQTKKEKSNNQRVKGPQISPRGRMRRISIPEYWLLNAADDRTRQRHPIGWQNSYEHRSDIKFHQMDRHRWWQLHHLHIHAMFFHLRSKMLLVMAIIPFSRLRYPLFGLQN